MKQIERLCGKHAALLCLLAIGVQGCGTGAGQPHDAGQTRSSNSPVERTRYAGSSSGTSLRRMLLITLHSVIAADARFGSTAAGVWVAGWHEPIAVGAAQLRQVRLWSLAKPIAAIAAYRAASASPRPSRSLDTAASDAMRRSDNCGERVVILELERLSGGAQGARRAFAKVLTDAGVNIAPVTTLSPSSEQQECNAYLSKRAPVSDAGASVWQFGTGEWTIGQAVGFAHGLADGIFGEPGARVLRLMRLAKQPSLVSLEGPTGEHIADLQWGAGRALAGLQPAYKAGWGGAEQKDFIASQIVVLDEIRPSIAIAVTFRPSREPRSEDLGETSAAQVIQDVLSAIVRALERERMLSTEQSRGAQPPTSR